MNKLKLPTHFLVLTILSCFSCTGITKTSPSSQTKTVIAKDTVYNEKGCQYTSYKNLVMAGYQGWFAAEGNGSRQGMVSLPEPETIDLHFKWMKEYGIDGVFMQRFGVEIKDANSRGKGHFNRMV